MAGNLPRAIVANPDQASTVFGITKAHPVNFKNLFVLRFVRKADAASDDWKEGMTFLAKSIERPLIQPATEEINQYNRKRVVHTGVKYNPINCAFYDTADGAALSLWAQYANYYFGDFGHKPNDYRDDIINKEMMGSRYGFGIATPTAAEPSGINSQFFFDRVEVYHLWGNEYTSFQLINPRITSFNPDDLDYEANAASMVTMSIIFETVYYVNSAKPAALASNSFLTQLFGGDFSGHTYDPQGMPRRENPFASTGSVASTAATTDPRLSLNTISDPNAFNLTVADVKKAADIGLGGGSISKFGSFDFGDFSSITSKLPSEISSLSNTDLGSISNIPDVIAGAGNTDLASISSGLTGLPSDTTLATLTNIPGINDTVGAALGSASSLPDISGAVNLASAFSTGSGLDQVVSSATDSIGSALSDFTTFGYDMPDQSTPHIPADTAATVTTLNEKKKKKKRIALAPLALATLNARADGTSQIGVRQNIKNPLLRFVKDPKPHSFFIGSLFNHEENDTAAATSVLKLKARVVRTEQSDTVSVLGTLRINAHGSVTEADDIVSALGKEVLAGHAPSLSETDDTVVSQSIIKIKASVAVVETSDGVSSQTVNHTHGAASITEASDTLTMVGRLRLQGSETAIENDDVMAATAGSHNYGWGGPWSASWGN